MHKQDVPCPASTDLSGVFADPIWSGLAGSNSTALVRMTSTSFAITDGTHVDYVDHTAQVCFCRLFGLPTASLYSDYRSADNSHVSARSVVGDAQLRDRRRATTRGLVHAPWACPRVSYDTHHEQGSADAMGLLGCTCIDLAVGIGINCTMLGKSGPLAWTYPVEW